MYKGKNTAIFVAVMMLLVSMVPLIGSLDATDNYFIGPFENVDPNAKEISTIDDLKLIGFDPDYPSDGSYVLTNDIIFEKEEIVIRISAALNNTLLAVDVEYTEDGSEYKKAEGVTVWFNGGSESTNEEGRVNFTVPSTFPSEFYSVYVTGDINGTEVSAVLFSTDDGDTVTEVAFESNFTPITNFSGTFDGNGHVISGLNIVTDGDAGLFAELTGTVKNLGILGGSIISTSGNAGSIAGVLTGGEMINCFSTAAVVAYSETSEINAGGLVGISNGSNTIENSYKTGSVLAIANGNLEISAGGIIGSANDTKIIGCFNSGLVEAYGLNNIDLDVYDEIVPDSELPVMAGGIAGYAAGNTILASGRNTGTIMAVSGYGSYVGGIAGYADDDVKIYSDHNLGKIYSVNSDTSNDYHGYAGGIAGSAPLIYNCFSTAAVDVKGGNTSSFAGGVVGELRDKIYNSYSAIGYSSITSSYSNGRGGIVGTTDGDGDRHIVNCYYYSQSSTPKLYGGDYSGSGSYAPYIDESTDNANGLNNTSDRDDVTASGGKTENQLKNRDTYYNEDIKENGVVIYPGWFSNTSSDDGFKMWLKEDAETTYYNYYPYLEGMQPWSVEILSFSGDQWVKSDEEATLTVVAFSDLRLTYQWQYSTNPNSDSGWTNVSDSSNSPTYTFTPTSSTSGRYYRCHITTPGSSVWSYNTSTIQVQIYQSDIGSIDDLLNIALYPAGEYKQTANIDLSNANRNDGVTITLTFKFNEDDDTITFTFRYATNKAAIGLNVWFNGNYGVTDTLGEVTFNNPADGVLIAGGVVETSKTVAVSFDIVISEPEDMSKDSNGNFNPIGTADSPFTGTFDGNGYKIIGLETASYSDVSSAYSGLFGYVQNATIKNVVIESGSSIAISSDNVAYAGGIIGYSESSVITGSANEGTVISVSHGADAYAGGILGYADSSLTINMSYNTGGITALSDSSVSSAGGIVGYISDADDDKNVSNTYNTGAISSLSASDAYAGGILGYANETLVSNTLNRGTVDSTGTVGGIAGYLTGDLVNSYYLNDQLTLNGIKTGDVLVGDGSPTVDGGDTNREKASGSRTATEISSRSTYYTENTELDDDRTVAGWDFASGNTWYMGSDGPQLKMAVPPDESEDDNLLLIAAIIIIAVIVVIIAAYLLLKRRKG